MSRMPGKITQKMHAAINHGGKELPVTDGNGKTWMVCPECHAKRELKL